MEGGRNGLSKLLGYSDGLPLQYKGLLKMDYIGPADGLFDDFYIAVGIREAAGFNNDDAAINRSNLIN